MEGSSDHDESRNGYENDSTFKSSQSSAFDSDYDDRSRNIKTEDSIGSSPDNRESSPVSNGGDYSSQPSTSRYSPPAKRSYSSEDDDEDIPLSKLKEKKHKKHKNGDVKVKEERKTPSPALSEDDEDYGGDDSDEDYGSSSKKKKKKRRGEEKKDKKDKKSSSAKKDKGKSKKRKADSDDDDDYSDYQEDSDFEEAKKSKKSKGKESKKASKGKDKKSSSKKSKKSESSPEKGSPRKKKKEEEEPEHIWKWWEESDLDSDRKWKTLEHSGPVFSPKYEPLPKDVKFKYDGKTIKLSEPAEEVATFYAKMLDHEYTSKETFNKNFFHDWRKFMTDEEKSTIRDLKKCDFTQMHQYFKEQSEARKNLDKEEKKKIKEENDRLAEKFGIAIVDGHKQKIGNFRLEPPGLFRGRGDHPKMGKVKQRIEAKDIIINIGKKATIPVPPDWVKKGKYHGWKEIRHDNTVTWLVSWTENIMGNVKYIMLNPSSKLKSMKDWKKYETARDLHLLIDKIRDDYRRDWKDREMVKRQRAVALYFIDRLALRAGNEKDDSEAADTVGCCSLRVEHIQLFEELNGKKYVVQFDFLGKDSMRYFNQVPVEKRVFKNLKIFMEKKRPGDDLFDRLDTVSLNKHLQSLMEGLSIKVFRTYNASITLERQLDELMKDGEDMSIAEKVLAYNRANRAVAILCNHQRTVPKGFEGQMEKLKEKIRDKEDQIKQAQKELKKAKKENDKKEKEKLTKKVKTLREQLDKLKVQETDKEENKQIALGTSKLNYLDPRITVAWCKKYEVPIEKVYTKTHREKFRWALEMAGPEYRFDRNQDTSKSGSSSKHKNKDKEKKNKEVKMEKKVKEEK